MGGGGECDGFAGGAGQTEEGLEGQGLIETGECGDGAERGAWGGGVGEGDEVGEFGWGRRFDVGDEGDQGLGGGGGELVGGEGSVIQPTGLFDTFEGGAEGFIAQVVVGESGGEDVIESLMVGEGAGGDGAQAGVAEGGDAEPGQFGLVGLEEEFADGLADGAIGFEPAQPEEMVRGGDEQEGGEECVGGAVVVKAADGGLEGGEEFVSVGKELGVGLRVGRPVGGHGAVSGRGSGVWLLIAAGAGEVEQDRSGALVDLGVGVAEEEGNEVGGIEEASLGDDVKGVEASLWLVGLGGAPEGGEEFLGLIEDEVAPEWGELVVLAEELGEGGRLGAFEEGIEEEGAVGFFGAGQAEEQGIVGGGVGRASEELVDMAGLAHRPWGCQW